MSEDERDLFHAFLWQRFSSEQEAAAFLGGNAGLDASLSAEEFERVLRITGYTRPAERLFSQCSSDGAIILRSLLAAAGLPAESPQIASPLRNLETSEQPRMRDEPEKAGEGKAPSEYDLALSPLDESRQSSTVRSIIPEIHRILALERRSRQGDMSDLGRRLWNLQEWLEARVQQVARELAQGAKQAHDALRAETTALEDAERRHERERAEILSMVQREAAMRQDAESHITQRLLEESRIREETLGKEVRLREESVGALSNLLHKALAEERSIREQWQSSIECRCSALADAFGELKSEQAKRDCDIDAGLAQRASETARVQELAQAWNIEQHSLVSDTRLAVKKQDVRIEELEQAQAVRFSALCEKLKIEFAEQLKCLRQVRLGDEHAANENTEDRSKVEWQAELEKLMARTLALEDQFRQLRLRHEHAAHENTEDRSLHDYANVQSLSEMQLSANKEWQAELHKLTTRTVSLEDQCRAVQKSEADVTQKLQNLKNTVEAVQKSEADVTQKLQNLKNTVDKELKNMAGEVQKVHNLKNVPDDDLRNKLECHATRLDEIEQKGLFQERLVLDMSDTINFTKAKMDEFNVKERGMDWQELDVIRQDMNAMKGQQVAHENTQGKSSHDRAVQSFSEMLASAKVEWQAELENLDYALKEQNEKLGSMQIMLFRRQEAALPDKNSGNAEFQNLRKLLQPRLDKMDGQIQDLRRSLASVSPGPELSTLVHQLRDHVLQLQEVQHRSETIVHQWINDTRVWLEQRLSQRTPARTTRLEGIRRDVHEQDVSLAFGVENPNCTLVGE